jgi:aldehyde dehydrogenase (NAD+)
MPPSYYQNIK